jgi:NADH dehydrogenase
MRIAVTGGTGFVGSHLCRSLLESGHEVVVISRGVDSRPGAVQTRANPGVTVVNCDLADVDSLANAIKGCTAIAHCAGINREIGQQTYQRVHVDATRNLIAAAEQAVVERLVLISFLRARPGTNSGYHDSKWQAEELVRNSQLGWTVLKSGMIFGLGDGMLDNLSRALSTFPVFVGLGSRTARPVAVDDVVRVTVRALTTNELNGMTIPIVGPDEMRFDEAARLVARVMGKRVLFVQAPLLFHRVLAYVAERAMRTPMVSASQITMLSEGISQGSNAPDDLPADLLPLTKFDEESVKAGLPKPSRYRLSDLRFPRFGRST